MTEKFTSTDDRLEKVIASLDRLNIAVLELTRVTQENVRTAAELAAILAQKTKDLAATLATETQETAAALARVTEDIASDLAEKTERDRQS